MKNTCFIPVGDRFISLRTEEIIYIELIKGVITLVTARKRLALTDGTMALDTLLSLQSFCKVSASCIVSVAHVQSFDNRHVYLTSDLVLPFESGYQEKLQSQVRVLLSETRGKKVN